MRIELSDPIPGLLMALPLIAILMTAGRSPIVIRQRTSQESERTISASQLARPCGSYQDVSGLGALGRRWDEQRYRPQPIGYVRTVQKWRNRPAAGIDCEVVAGCQLTAVLR